MKDKREIYLDMIRVWAIILVLFTHTGELGSKLYTITSNHALIPVYISLDVYRTINNCLLFMISGALLLGKEESIKDIWKKRIFRFAFILIVFSIIQYAISLISGEASLDIIGFLRSIYSKPIRTSYWYLYAYISFLILLPFTRMIAKKLTVETFWYLFLSSVVILDVLPIFELVFGFSRYNLTLYLYGMNILFPILGYYMHNNWKTQVFKTVRSRCLLYGGALLGVCIATGLMLYEKYTTGSYSETYITKFYIVTAVATFGGMKSLAEKIQISNMAKQVLIVVSNSVFGIFLLENVLAKVTIYVYRVADIVLPRIFACGIYIVATIILGTIVMWGIKKIPGVNKFL